MSLDEGMPAASPASGTGLPPSAGTAPGPISVVGARKYFGVTRALDGCSFSARLGEIHAIVGGNGCGKSTLAKVISGVLPLDGGQVQVLGHTPTTPHEARAIGVATVFQEVLVADECSIVDNVFMGVDNLFSTRLSAREKALAADAMMRDLTGERIDIHDLVGTLPLGLKQWITIARALMTNPKVLILDESSAALDFDSTERLFAKMRQLRDQGSAVLIVTHRIAELIRISDRATVMRDGRDVGVLDKVDITERNLIGLMTGRPAEKRERTSTAAAALEAPAVLRIEDLVIWPGAEPVDLTLHRGEILGVAGLDGQGQADFVRILAGIQPAFEGTPVAIHEDGETAIRSLADATEAGIVYVSGDRKKEGIFANLSIFENVLIPLYRSETRGGKLGLIDWGSLEGIFDWEVRKLAIKMGDRGDKVTSLSGGNQQKALIARGFAMKPDIIVLNDPARGIDVGAKSELYRHLRDFAASGKSVVYMSSELEEFIGFASRVIVFRHGTVFDAFTGSGIEPGHILEAMFGQTAGLQRRARTRPTGEAAEGATAGVRVSVAEAKAWKPRPAAVDNPLGKERPRIDNPLKPAQPARAAAAKPAAPHVPDIRIVEFGTETPRPPAKPRDDSVSPFRRREGGR